MKKNIYILIILLITVSCENELPFNVKDNPPKLILNAFLDADKEYNDIILGVTARDRAIIVEKASVDVYVNGELKDQIAEPYSVPNPYGVKDIRYKTNVKLKPDDVVKVEARTDDGKYHVWSEVIVPRPISIENIDTTTITKKWWNNFDKFLRVRTTFTDDGRPANYYRIAITIYAEIEAKSIETGIDTLVNMSTKYPLLINEDIVLTDGRPFIDNDDDDILPQIENLWGIFDNSRINGTYTMITGVRVPYVLFEKGYEYLNGQYEQIRYEQINKVRVKVRLQLMSITRMQFLYLKALNIYDSVDYDDFFNLPVKLPSNIEDGTGIFGVSIGDQAIIDLGEYIPQNTTE